MFVLPGRRVPEDYDVAAGDGRLPAIVTDVRGEGATADGGLELDG